MLRQRTLAEQGVIITVISIFNVYAKLSDQSVFSSTVMATNAILLSLRTLNINIFVVSSTFSVSNLNRTFIKNSLFHVEIFEHLHLTNCAT